VNRIDEFQYVAVRFGKVRKEPRHDDDANLLRESAEMRVFAVASPPGFEPGFQP
jgi:hypothetical protein